MPIETLKYIYIFDDQMGWGFLKFEIRKFSIDYSISKTRNSKGEYIILENKFKVFEQDLEKNKHNQKYFDCKRKLNNIFDRDVEVIKIRSKCHWYEKEKKIKIFLESWKNRALRSKVHLEGKFLCKRPRNITENLYQLYENLFSNDVPVSNKSIWNHLEKRELREVKDGKQKKKKTKKLQVMMVLKKNFLKRLGLKSKVLFFYLSKKVSLTEELSTSQKQAVIKLSERKDKDKRLIKERPIYLINTLN